MTNKIKKILDARKPLSPQIEKARRPLPKEFYRARKPLPKELLVMDRGIPKSKSNDLYNLSEDLIRAGQEYTSNLPSY